MEMHCGTCRHFGNIDYSKKQCVECQNSGTRIHWEAPLSDTMDQQRATERQVGGDHYAKLAIQPMQYSMANKLDACQHTIIKYVTRFRDKGGIQDLEKAKHVIDLLIEFEQSK